MLNHAKFMVKQITDQLKKCSSLQQVESWYTVMLKTSTHQDCFAINQYITVCSKLKNTESAVFAFTQIKNPNVFVYNAIIGAFVNCLNPEKALCYYVEMLRNDVFPSSYTFPPVIKSCRILSVVGFGECVHGQVLKCGFGLKVHIMTAFIDFYSSLSRIDESVKVFEEMPERDGFAWSTMVSVYVRVGDLGSAKRVFDEMPEKNVAAWNMLIHGYVEGGDLELAKGLFVGMVERDLISWTTMINACVKHKRHREALELFYEMKGSGIRPDEVTMATVISACAHLGALDQGKKIHFYVMGSGFELDVFIGSALVDMYSKCGALERALVVFFNLPEKNIVCWSSVIDGLAFHGRAKEAFAMFERMEMENIKPNSVIFVSVLAACTHAGLVEEGRRIFLEMTNKYFIFPEIEHYGCMVDLLGRAGLLEEALELISCMRMEPNSIIWGSLLNGCKLHKNLKIAQVAVDKLTHLEPNSGGYSTLLLNMYAEERKWMDVGRIRANMKEYGVEKIWPGSSWIEVKKEMHQFVASDNHHPALEEIYLVLDVLDSQLKLFAYAPDSDLITKVSYG